MVEQSEKDPNTSKDGTSHRRKSLEGKPQKHEARAFPNSLNAETGLKCIYVGGRRELEKLTISRILEVSKPNVTVTLSLRL
jgi:hypothetical protein